MSRNAFLLFTLASALALPAMAAPRAYEPVAVAFDRKAENDEALKALIARLKTATGARDIAAFEGALAPTFAVVTCSSDPTQACAPGKRSVSSGRGATPADRLKQGLCCGDMPKSEITPDIVTDNVIGQFAAALEAESISAHPDLPDLACLPAWPVFDRAKAQRMAKQADVEAENLRIVGEEIVLRTAPKPDAPAVLTLRKGDIAPMVTETGDNFPDGWYAIALPKGGLGYTDMLGLNEMAPTGVCFAKAGPDWKIALFVLREQ